MTKRPTIFHPFLLAPLPVLLLYSRNLQAVDPADALMPVALSVLGTGLAFGVLRLLRLEAPKAALIVSAGLMLFFSFGVGVRSAERLGLGRDRVIRERLILALEAAALASVAGIVLRKPAVVRPLNVACDATSIGLAGLAAFGIVAQLRNDPAARPPRAPAPIAPRFTPPAGRRPDVYFLVLDAYGRSDVLKERYGFDNSGFLGRLEGKGFVVARSSTANYCQTALSMAATLNLRYLDDLAGNRSSDRLPLKDRIADNAAFRAFRGQGYRLVTFASGFDATESLGADLTLAPPFHLRTFPSLVAGQTPLWLLLGQQRAQDPYRKHRDRINKVLDDLPIAPDPSGSPTFTFAHILAPHPPFVFGADGRDLSGGEGAYSLNDSEGWCQMKGHDGPEDYARRYRDQVTYLTNRLERVIDRILASSATPPIILIQGDHGPGSRFDSGAERPNDVDERMSILNACYLPESSRGRIGDAITPVNTLRVVLDESLGSKLGPIEDRNFYSAYQTPYAFIEVTGELRSSDE